MVRTRLLRIAGQFILPLVLVLLTRCTYDKENELYPEPPACDSAGVMTYQGSIRPIMEQWCNRCHPLNSANGIVTANYEGLSIIAQSGQLWASVSWQGVPMPQDATDTIPVCDRVKLKKWLDAGSPDN